MRLPKWAVPAVGVLIVGGALYFRHLDELKEQAKAHAEALASEQSGIRITAKAGDQCPTRELPIRVTVKNTTQRTLKSVTFHLGVYEEGRVDDLDPSAPDEQWTTAIAPGAEESRCRPVTLPIAARQLVKAEKRGPNGAVFYAKGEPVPRPAR